MRIKPSGSNRRVSTNAIHNFMSRGDVGGCGKVFVMRDVRFQPPTALRVGDGVGNNNTDVGECRPWTDDDVEVHGNKVLAQNLKSSRLCERILRRTHATFDGILDGNHRRLRSAINHRSKCLTDIVHRKPVGTGGFWHLSKSGPREGANGS